MATTTPSKKSGSSATATSAKSRLADDRFAWRSWHDAACDPEIDQSLRTLYNNLDAQVNSRSPTCWISGKCCHFDAYGHRLYVTGLEIAWVLVQVEKNPPDHSTIRLDGPCPFQTNNLCSIHTIRPMGCRIFFCQEGTSKWQNELYEEYLNTLKNSHEVWGLPYRYMEWRSGLQQGVETLLRGDQDAPRVKESQSP